jgi:hypothetical protein
MFTMGMQGFGRSKVRGRSRVPSPPHMMQTFIEEYGAAGLFKGHGRRSREPGGGMEESGPWMLRGGPGTQKCRGDPGIG